MNTRVSRKDKLLSELEEKFLSEIEEEYLARDGKRPRITRRISRRDLLRSGAGTAVVSAVGAAGLMELLANREAIAQGDLIAIMGVTRERIPLSETPHRHTFSAKFLVKTVSPEAIIGNVSGQTSTVISTSSVEEDDHFHLIERLFVSLEQIISSGPENNEADGHVHPLHID
jgi:hypothetical protein